VIDGPRAAPLIGVLVGGEARRMGGVPKGLVMLPSGEPVLGRTLRVAREAFPEAPRVLVGRAEPYAAFGLEALPDAPDDIGPLGGLLALLTAGAGARRDVIALACDMPSVPARVLGRLAPLAPSHDALAPRVQGLWQPLCAGYRSAPCLEAARRVLTGGRRSLFAVLDALGPRAAVLPLNEEDAASLTDWDTPDEVARGGGRV
jgi:molybdenum cofactor guanylyltransferase